MHDQDHNITEIFLNLYILSKFQKQITTTPTKSDHIFYGLYTSLYIKHNKYLRDLI